MLLSASEVRYVSLCGMLGYGYPLQSLSRAMAAQPAFIGVDAGSTDPGPYYLGAGVNFVKSEQVKRDLRPALCTALDAQIPLIVGSAGGSGGAPHVTEFLDVLSRIAEETGRSVRAAVIDAEVPPHTVLEALEQGRITPCGPAPELTPDAVADCSRIVAQMGTGPIIEALGTGADIIVAGRACDTAIFAALPIMEGFDPALALHAAKIAECGTLCALPGGANDALTVTLREDHFIVEPANPEKRCLPDTVAAHSLYEQPDPNCFHEPEGTVDLTACGFERVGDRGVRVSGTRLHAAEYHTVKLEGAALRGYRAVSIAGTTDPGVIASMDEIEQGVRERLDANLPAECTTGGYSLRFLRYGLDAVAGGRHRSPGPPHELGIVIDVVAPTQQAADTIVSLARSTALHQPFTGRKTTAGNFAFPFSPSDLRAGPVYEFAVYHLMQVDDPSALFSIRIEEF